MRNDSSAIVQKVPPSPRLHRTGNPIPAEFQWSELSSKSGDPASLGYAVAGDDSLTAHHYRHTLENLGTEPGLVGIIPRSVPAKPGPAACGLMHVTRGNHGTLTK